MRETARAQQAFNDYLNLGPERSLEKLLARYQNATDSVPTRRMMSLKNWSRALGWQQRLVDIAERERAAIVAQGIADRQNRVDAENRRHQLMQQVIAERAASPEMENIPGGTTGLLVRTFKAVGAGRNAQLVEEFAVDTGLLREMREHEKQVAQDLGQWEEKSQVSGQQFVRIYERDRHD